jgi:ketosteroid isomerase-like protein
MGERTTEERVAGAAMTPERLAEFGEAWNEQDVDLVMGYMADGCRDRASFGPAPGGASYEGREAVREGVALFFERYPGGTTFEDSRVFLAGDRGAAEWTFACPGSDSKTVRVKGCNLFEFEGKMVKTKDAFRKQVG